MVTDYIKTKEIKKLRFMMYLPNNKKARKTEEKVNQSDIDGLYDVYWVTNKLTGELGDEFNLYNAISFNSPA